MARIAPTAEAATGNGVTSTTACSGLDHCLGQHWQRTSTAPIAGSAAVKLKVLPPDTNSVGHLAGPCKGPPPHETLTWSNRSKSLLMDRLIPVLCHWLPPPRCHGQC